VTEKPQQLEWEASEFIFNEKSREWYWALFVIVAAIVASSFFLKNTLLAVFAVIGGFTIALYGAKKPTTVLINISGRGIQVGEVLYSYESIESFWIYYDPPFLKDISLQSTRAFGSNIRIPLGDTDPQKVRDLLIQYIHEEVHEESLTDVIARRIGF
jgi:hypothetical protein